MKRDDQRLTWIEQNLGFVDDLPSPLHVFHDPFVLYREERATARAARAPPVDESGPSSDPHGKWSTRVHLDVDDDDTTKDEYEDDDDEDGDDGNGDDANDDNFEA